MDTIVHAAIEEICSNGVNGITLAQLWNRLHASITASGLTLCPAVKRAVISGLSSVPGIRVGTGSDQDSDLVEVVADEKLRGCFVGLYDIKSSQIALPQHRVLDRLAAARGTGLTQYQLCKELGVPANNFGYVVKRLESWGLIVRHSTVVRTKEAGSDKEPKGSQPFHTNLIRLHRYAPLLNSQLRFEITKESNTVEEDHEGGQDDVRVKDFLPALKAICDRLEQAEGQVLVVYDIKKELRYHGVEGHRNWRRDCGRLERAGLVEKFEAHVGSEEDTSTKSKKSKSSGKKKPVSCLKLLKKFSPKLFEHKTTDCENDNLESEKQVQNTEQLVELPLEEQIMDIIDAEDSKGLLGVEACKRLGINNKMFDTLCNAIVPRYGLHQLSENHKKGSAYRFWTSRSFCSQLPNPPSIRSEHGSAAAEFQETVSPAENPFRSKTSKKPSTLADLYSKKWLTEKDPEKGVTDDELEHGNGDDRGITEMVDTTGGSDNVQHDMSITFPCAGDVAQSNSLVEAPSPVLKLCSFQEGRLYPSVTTTTRELRIREIVETQKLIITPELQNLLESAEKDNQATIDRRTINRILKKLQNEGHCKVMEFHIPGVTNGGRHREMRVVLHSSVKGSASELSEQVHDKMRLFEIKNRSTRPPLRKEFPVPILHGIERIHMNSTPDVSNTKFEELRANGLIFGKMARAKLLHCFLWDYVNNLARCTDASSNLHGSCLLFSLDTAIKAMPLQLYMQVVGAPHKWKDIIEKFKNGFCLSDFPKEDYESLMDTEAARRLSRPTGILLRLKLIRLVADESLTDAVKNTHTTLVYALNREPYIEEPSSVDPLSLPGCWGSVDLRPHFRHDFVLSTTEAVENYWQTLENCYATAHPKAAVHAFPGSVAYEVLRVYYDNRQKRLNKCEGDSDVQLTGSDARNARRRALRKRKRLLEESCAKHVMANYPTDSPEVEEDEQEQQESSMEPCIMPVLKQARHLKFSWTEEADRQLITQYARQKAIQGARSGTEWASIKDLPAAPTVCRRRLAYLHSNDKFRISLVKLCNLLSQRYAQYLDNARKSMLEDNSEELDSPGKHWDDFEDSKIMAAFDEVLMIKRMMKLAPAKRTGSAFQGLHEPVETMPCELDNDGEKQQISSIITRRVHQSLAVSSAVELFKLHFLTNSNSEDMPNLLQETLRRYSQHDLYTAFDYLKQRKILIGSDSSIFLSQNFLRSLSLSQFPTNTGTQASKLASWIHGNEKDLKENALNLPSDLQCGDIYQLMALVSSGELSISSVLPHEGVGEAEDSRNLKRQYDDHEYDNLDMSKKQKFNSLVDSEMCSRREKGFPGITVSLSRTTFLRSNVVEFFKNDDQNLLLSGDDHFYATLGRKSNCTTSSINHFKETPDFDGITPSTIISGYSIWGVMANLATHNLSNHLGRENSSVTPELVKSTYMNTQKAGDQGLTMSAISEYIGIRGTIVSEHVVSVLELFRLVLKVNAHDDVRVVDGLYRAKYFLTPYPTSSQDPETTLPITRHSVDDAMNTIKESITHEHEANCSNTDDVHKVTILNLPKDGWQPSNAIQARDKFEGSRASNKNQNLDIATAFHPILPWINPDGTINAIVYRGLTRRILGIVTQNPGILEDGILKQMNALNPQSCRKLLKLMVLDKHLFLRKMSQRTSSATAPTLLGSLIGNHFKKAKYICREHYFSNPASTGLL
ncbi:uncharacterized protein LOC141648427 [Silene latifolia]|uniref:uncharacterized protein LOC141648427 n=1 Tax=Silene latifolia TaxID=37657 RepID=UPI003D76EFD1